MTRPRRLSLLLALALGGAALLPSAASAQQTPRVLVVGDSWAELMWDFRSLSWAFDRMGHGHVREEGTLTAIGGTTAEGWKQPNMLGLIDSELVAYPTIDVVHLVIGGNDFLGNWSTNMSMSAENALFDQIAVDIDAIVQHVLALDPGLQVVVVGYDYTNFEEMRFANPFNFFIWLGLGSPTPTEINTASLKMSSRILGMFGTEPRVHMVNHHGNGHFAFGYANHGIAPQTLPFPGNAPTGYRPAAGGDPALPGNPDLMLDSIHLNEQGYRGIAASCTWYFYDAWFTANP